MKRASTLPVRSVHHRYATHSSIRPFQNKYHQSHIKPLYITERHLYTLFANKSSFQSSATSTNLCHSSTSSAIYHQSSASFKSSASANKTPPEFKFDANQGKEGDETKDNADGDDNYEDITARAKANSEQQQASRLYRLLRFTFILALILGYPIYIIRYNGKLPFQSYLIDQIKEKGADSWVYKILPYIIWCNNFRTQLLNDEEAVQQLISLLNPSKYPSTTYQPLIMILFTLTQTDPYTQEQLASIPNLTSSLLNIAMFPDVEKELSYMCFAIIAKLILHPQARAEFIAAKGVQRTCRATRARSAEVANAATEVLTNLLIDFPDVKSLKLTPKEQNDLFMTVTNLGAMFQEQKQHHASITAYKQSLALDPLNVPIMCQLGGEYSKLGYYDEAEKQFRRGLKIDPSHVDSAYYLSKTLLSKSRSQKTYDEISKILQNSIDLYNSPQAQHTRQQQHQPDSNPLLSPSYSLLIHVLEELGRLADAEEYAREWSLRSSADAVSHYNYGRMLLRNRDLRNALRELEIAKQFDPSRAEIYYQLALGYYKLNRLDEALNYALKAEEISKSNADAGVVSLKRVKSSQQQHQHQLSTSQALANVELLLGKIHMKRDEIDDAIKCLESYDSLRPSSAESKIALAMCYQSKHQLPKAYQQFTKLVNQWFTSIPHNPKSNNLALKQWAKTHPKEYKAYAAVNQVCTSAKQTIQSGHAPHELTDLCSAYNSLIQPVPKQEA